MLVPNRARSPYLYQAANYGLKRCSRAELQRVLHAELVGFLVTLGTRGLYWPALGLIQDAELFAVVPY
jgi:hypothetical protein